MTVVFNSQCLLLLEHSLIKCCLDDIFLVQKTLRKSQRERVIRISLQLQGIKHNEKHWVEKLCWNHLLGPVTHTHHIFLQSAYGYLI